MRVIIDAAYPVRIIFNEQKTKAQIYLSLNPHHSITRFLNAIHPPNIIMIVQKVAA